MRLPPLSLSIRFLAVLVVLLVAYAALTAEEAYNRHTQEQRLATQTEKMAASLHTWLDRKAALAEKMAAEPRFLLPLDTSDPTKKIPQQEALQEFASAERATHASLLTNEIFEQAVAPNLNILKALNFIEENLPQNDDATETRAGATRPTGSAILKQTVGVGAIPQLPSPLVRTVEAILFTKTKGQTPPPVTQGLTVVKGKTLFYAAAAVELGAAGANAATVYLLPVPTALEDLPPPYTQAIPDIRTTLTFTPPAGRKLYITKHNDIRPLATGNEADLPTYTLFQTLRLQAPYTNWSLTAGYVQSATKIETTLLHKAIEILAGLLTLTLLCWPGYNRQNKLKSLLKSKAATPYDQSSNDETEAEHTTAEEDFAAHAAHARALSTGRPAAHTARSHAAHSHPPTAPHHHPKHALAHEEAAHHAAQKARLIRTMTERAEPVRHKLSAKEAVMAYNIRTAVHFDRIQLLFQPVYAVTTNQPIMHEVFLRIFNEAGDIIPPNEFLPVARKENLLASIDEKVIVTAVKRHILGTEKTQIPMAFNLAGNTFDSLKFLEELMRLAEFVPDLPAQTIFEIHSKEMIQDKKAMKFIRECRDMGFQFSVDYFGGGIETIKAAKRLKFNYIKADALKVNFQNREEQKNLILVAKTAQALDLPLILERVENEQVVTFCQKVGIPYVQGYHLAKPHPKLVI